MNTRHTLSMLQGDSTVSAYLLEEDEELMELIKANVAYDELLEYVNETY